MSLVSVARGRGNLSIDLRMVGCVEGMVNLTKTLQNATFEGSIIIFLVQL